MAVNKRAAGADKEQLAARYLVDNGYTVLERNFRNKTGEIDIIAKKDNYSFTSFRISWAPLHTMKYS